MSWATYLAAAWESLKYVPWYAIALPMVFFAGCCGGCSCERGRHAADALEAETTVLTINGKDFTYDRLPDGGWKRRD